MVKPVWASFAGVALLAITGVAGALVVTSSEGEEEVVQQVETATPTGGDAKDPRNTPTVPAVTTPSQPPGAVKWRWGNVTILVPDTPDINVLSQSTPAGGPGIEIIRDTDHRDNIFSRIVLDATNGNIVINEVRSEDALAVDALLATLSVSSPDRSAAWPYTGDPPPAIERKVYGAYSYFSPLPETGFHLSGGIGDPGGEFIGLSSVGGAVVVSIDPRTGQLLLEYHVNFEEDRAPLERWVAEVEICGSETEC